MRFDISGFRIVDRPESLQLQDDPAKRYAGRCQAVGYIVGLDLTPMEPAGLNVATNGDTTECPLRCVEVDGHALVVGLPYSDDVTPDGTAYLYVRAGHPRSPWQAATKMLVLPGAPWERGTGDDDTTLRQKNGRVMAYVALATLNNWFAPENA